jgi:hypothetical protein
MKEFDKYYYYHKSVQSPDADVLFFDKTFKELKGREAITLKEDFCGTFSISCEWSKLNENKQACGVDLDLEPIEYGKEKYLSKLNEDQKSRVRVIHGNVMSPENPSADIVSASNFSYFIFKTRAELKDYFAKAYNSVNNDGLFILDCFGGTDTTNPVEEETEHEEGFSYFWDQDSFDPVSNFAQFYIHFQREGEEKREKVFSYDWRMWSIPEIKDLLLEVGFKDVTVYWEGTDEDGEGDGVFKAVKYGEDCESWISYIVGHK